MRNTTLILCLVAITFWSCDDDSTGSSINQFAFGYDNEFVEITKLNPNLELYVDSGEGHANLYLNEDSSLFMGLSVLNVQPNGFANWQNQAFIQSSEDGLYILYRDMIDSLFVCSESLPGGGCLMTQFNGQVDFDCSGNQSLIDVSDIRKLPQTVAKNSLKNTVELKLLSGDMILATDASSTLQGSCQEDYLTHHPGLNDLGPVYVPIVKDFGGELKYGWILLEVQGYNKIIVYEYGWEL